MYGHVMRRLRRNLLQLWLAAAVSGYLASSLPAGAQADSAGRIDSTGVVSLPKVSVPLSPLLTPEYRRDYLKSLSRLGHSAGPIDEWQASVPAFQVRITPSSLAGVPIEIIEPSAGVAQRNTSRVLINLHGGGFFGGWGTNSRAESVPMAVWGRVKVITVNYREAPEAKFPAASEDVASVYRALLKQYRPENIGIYGCSSGGTLTAESLAWFQTHDLPPPGAAGIFCSGAIAGSLGDSHYLGMLVTGRDIPKPTLVRGFAFMDDYFGTSGSCRSLVPK